MVKSKKMKNKIHVYTQHDSFTRLQALSLLT